MKLIALLLRIAAWVEFRALEMELDERNKALDATYDMALYFELLKSREDTKTRLAKARAKYTATFPPGVRFTWRGA